MFSWLFFPVTRNKRPRRRIINYLIRAYGADLLSLKLAPFVLLLIIIVFVCLKRACISEKRRDVLLYRSIRHIYLQSIVGTRGPLHLTDYYYYPSMSRSLR